MIRRFKKIIAGLAKSRKDEDEEKDLKALVLYLTQRRR